jgi:hypothetical protein
VSFQILDNNPPCSGRRDDAVQLLQCIQGQCLPAAEWCGAYYSEEKDTLIRKLEKLADQLAGESADEVIEIMSALQLSDSEQLLPELTGCIIMKMLDGPCPRSDAALALLNWAGLKTLATQSVQQTYEDVKLLHAIFLDHLHTQSQQEGLQDGEFQELAQRYCGHLLSMYLAHESKLEVKQGTEGESLLFSVEDIMSRTSYSIPPEDHLQQALAFLEAAAAHVQLQPAFVAAVVQLAAERCAWGVAADAAELGSQQGVLPPHHVSRCAIAALDDGQTQHAAKMLASMGTALGSGLQQSSSSDLHKVQSSAFGAGQQCKTIACNRHQ